MIESKSFASLSSGLLARKGGAKPAMRPQGLGHYGSGMDDLGWNDMGSAAQAQAPAVPASRPVTALTPMRTGFEPAPAVVEQQRAAIAASFGSAKVAEQSARAEPMAPNAGPAAKPGSKSKTAFTLRLEADRHLKLRLACAVTGRSAQQLVTEALDRLLETHPEIAALADQLPGNQRRPG